MSTLVSRGCNRPIHRWITKWVSRRELYAYINRTQSILSPVVFSMSGHIHVVARTPIRRKYIMEDYYFICLVDSVCVPSTCSFLRCFATCSAVGKEWSHFGHVKPVSDMMSDWTISNKKHTSVCHSIIQIAQLDMLIFFSLFTYQTRQCRRQQQAGNHGKWY